MQTLPSLHLPKTETAAPGSQQAQSPGLLCGTHTAYAPANAIARAARKSLSA